MLKILNWNSVLFVSLLVFLRLQSIGFPGKFYLEEVVEGIKIKSVFLFVVSERPIPMSKRPIFSLFTLGRRKPSIIFSDLISFRKTSHYVFFS